MIEFKEFPKIARLSREIIITEKIDGTNASIYIAEDLAPITLESGRVVPFLVGSRTRWIYPENDNAGFAKWAFANADELLKLGAGQHFGEWWGQGIQRNYGLTEKRFSLFNVSRWWDKKADLLKEGAKQEYCPNCCHVVPVLYQGVFDTTVIEGQLNILKCYGSKAVKGFQNPEGIVIYHTAARLYFKKTIEKDEKGKSE